MEKEFVTYNQALALKELGFDPFMKENCLAYFNTSNSNNDLETKDWWHLPKNDFQYALSAPLKQQLFRWFREKHNLHHEIEFNEDEYLAYVNGLTANIFKTYEEAESASIDRLIEIVKNK